MASFHASSERSQRIGPWPGPGPAADLDAQPWSKGERAVFVAFCCALLLSLFVTVHPWYDSRNDASLYLACAKSLAQGEGYSFLEQPFVLRPPGFSLILVPIVAARGYDFYALNFFVSFFGVLCVLGLCWFHRRRIGMPLALVVAAALWLNGPFQTMSTQVMSDVPGGALILGCLLVERWSSRRHSWRRELPLGVCVGVCSYVRSVTILIIPALIVSRLLEYWLMERPKPSWIRFGLLRIAVVTVSALMIQVPWSIRNALKAPPPPAEQTALYSYSTALWHVDKGDPSLARISIAEFLSRARDNVPRVLGSLGSRMREQGGGGIALGIYMLLCSAYVLVRRRAPADFFALGVVVVLSLYFGHQPRLVLPAYLVIFPSVVEFHRDLLARLGARRYATGICAALVLGLIVLDLDLRQNWETIRRDHEEFVSLAARVNSELKPDERVATWNGRHHNVYLDRPVFSLERAVTRAGQESADSVLDRYAVDAVFLRLDGVPLESLLLQDLVSRSESVVDLDQVVMVRVPR